MDDVSRRALGVGTAAIAVAATLQRAVAQSASGGGSWLDMVKAQHVMIVQTLDEILATNDSQAGERRILQKKLAYLLTAHATAEENVLYPALAKLGMTAASDQLYLEQAHAKVINADLGMSPAGTTAWLAEVSALKTALVHHAKDEEEADLFPKLMAAAGPAMNAKLTHAYEREFDVVRRT